jgi:hypothetical protein
MSTDAIAESSTAQPTFDPSDQNTWSGEQRAEWNKSGSIPKPTKQESAPAKTSEENAASRTEDAETKSAEESATSKPQEKKAHLGTPAPKRNEQLRAEVQELEALLAKRKSLKAELEAEPKHDAKTAASSPAKPAEPPKRPNPYTFKGTPEELDKAMDEYEAAREEYLERRFVEKQQASVRNQQFIAKVEDARARYGQEQFDATIESASKAIAEQAAPTVKEYLQRSDLFADLLYVIGGTEKSLNDFLGSAKSDPIAAIRKLAFLEIEIGKELSKGKEKPEEKPEKPEVKAEAPAKPEPRAPKPPSEVGGRGTAPTDEAAEAARSGDYRKFEAEQNRRMQARYAKA